MKKSIKIKLTITFIIVIVCCIGSILLFNTLFLEKLYINEKKNIIKKSYIALESGITEAYDMGYNLQDLFKKKRNADGISDESNLSRFIRELQEIYGVNTILMDSNNKIYSLFQNNSMFDRRMKDYIYRDLANNKSLQILEKNDLYTIAINNHTFEYKKRGVESGGPPVYSESNGPGDSNNVNNNYGNSSSINIKRDPDIECFGFLSDNETAFFLTIPVGSIKESIDLFNKILIILSFISIISGSIAIYFISNNMTKPLLELSNIAMKMSRLEFENKYEVKSEDEIGKLGTAINELSFKLEKAIKELKNANIQLKMDLEKKEQLDLMRQDFVANVSHELKTPIALIRGYAEGLENQDILKDDENRNYYISVIKDEAEKMNSLVYKLLNLSSLERGMEELTIERINLLDVVNGVANNFAITINDKKINLLIDILDKTFVWADGYKLEDVVRNYISNAINHVDDNKFIKVYTENIDGEKIRLSVFNSGLQLDEEERKKIWEKFYKVDKARTRSYGGTGLGLSIVKAIAEKHNTTCGCDNVEIDGFNGMKFYFDLNIK
ncbi:MAG: HAMP domain-containing protein [Lachnospiraceae bacterium]|nr:HAMP domain-containing protein [Lachnospiraceae bacterium]